MEGAKDCQEDWPDPDLGIGVEYGAAASHASEMRMGAAVTIDCATLMIFGVPTETTIEN